MRFLNPELKGLAGAATEKDSRDGAKEDLNIEPERPLIDVLEVEADPVRKIVHLVASRDLPQTGHSRGNAEAPPLGIRGHGDGLVGG